MHSAVTPGTIIDQRYRVERQLGEGAHGAVYLVEDIQLQRPVAVKLVSIPVDESGELVARLQREARALNKFVNPHIVQVFRIGWRSDHEMYLAMEFVDGVSLRSLLDVKPMSFHDAIAIALQIAEALYHAEKEGVTHRDVKPQNVLVGSDDDGKRVAKLADFGLCKLQDEMTDAHGRLTHTGVTLGTPAYMSPEQCYGQQTDVRSDIYSFGCTLFEMLTGLPPFTAETPAALLIKHVSEQPPRLLDLVKRTGMPTQLQDMYLRCLQKIPSDRYQSFGQIIQDLREIEDRLEGNQALQINDTHRLRRYLQRARGQPLLRSAGILLVVLLLTCFGIVLAATGEQKGRAIAAISRGLSPRDPIPLMVQGVSVVFVFNGSDMARSAADATTSRQALAGWTSDRRVELDAAYMRFFEERKDEEPAGAFAQSVILYYIQKLDASFDRRRLSDAERSQLQDAVRFYLHNDVKREYWFGLNRAFDAWDLNRSYAAFVADRPDLEMEMQELCGVAVLRSGSAVSGHHYRRACGHFQAALLIAGKLSKESDFMRLAGNINRLPNPDKTREYEFLCRLEVARYWSNHSQPKRAEKEVETCRRLLRDYIPLTEENVKELDAVAAKIVHP